MFSQFIKKPIIVGNYGNDTLALVQWAYEQKLIDLTVVSVNTGFAGEGWLEHVHLAEKWVQSLGFACQRLLAHPDFTELMLQRQSFPSVKFQWCANVLKAKPLLAWLDQIDPQSTTTLLIGHRHASARSKQAIAEYIEHDENWGERAVWHPLIHYSTEQRNALLARAKFSPLKHRSLECDPCVNSNYADFQRVSPEIKIRLKKLEDKLNKKMLSFEIGQEKEKNCDDVLENMGCGNPYACGI